MKGMLYGAILIAACFVGIAQAQQPRLVGTWLITTDKDRFTGDPTAIAMTIQHGSVLALRCLQRELSFAVKDDTVSGLTGGQMFVVSFKGGDHPVTETVGDAVNDSMIEVIINDDIRGVLLSSNEYAFRFMGDTQQFDEIFQAGTATKSLAPVIKACPPGKDADPDK